MVKELLTVPILFFMIFSLVGSLIAAGIFHLGALAGIEYVVLVGVPLASAAGSVVLLCRYVAAGQDV